MKNRINCKKSQILQILVKVLIFLSGVSLLIWQIHGTIETFIKKRTSFANKQVAVESMDPPTIVFCSRNHRKVGQAKQYVNISNENQFKKEFFWLNEKLNLTIFKFVATSIPDKLSIRPFSELSIIFKKNLGLGENKDEKGNLLVTIEELMNPIVGLCYAIIPGEIFKLRIDEYITLVATYEQKQKKQKATMYFTSEKDRYGLLTYDLGRMIPFKISPDTGIAVGVNLKKRIWTKLESKGNCKQYTKDQSFMKCLLKNQVECFRLGNQTCKCIPENTHKTHFKLFPIPQNVCTNDEEYKCGFWKMLSCYFNKMVTKRCPLPCEKEVYQGQKMYFNRWAVDSNKMLIEMKYSTMNIHMHEEYEVQDTYSFIGTVGGSFGLFIGFSYTGCLENVWNYVLRASNANSKVFVV